MRIKAFVFLLLAAAVSHGQVWEKHLAPGLSYRMEVDSATPRVIHVLRFSPGGAAVQAVSELAAGVVYLPNDTKGRETISEMVARTGAIAGINGDFFPFTGHPVGVMVRSDELISIPTIPRAVFGWGPKSTSFATCLFKGTMSMEGQSPILLTGLNEECGANRVVLNTSTAGMAITKPGGIHAVFRMDSASWKPNSVNTGTLLYLVTDSDKVPVQQGNAIVTAFGPTTAWLRDLKVGQKATFKFETAGMDWGRIQQAIGGGPYLVRKGAISVDATAEKFDDAFTLKRHARSAVGTTKDGDILLVAIESRANISEGATLDELAKIMQRLGCVEAANLDGGGSTTFNIFGLTLNSPTGGKERPVANGLLFYGPKPDPGPGAFTLGAPETLIAGQTVQLAIHDAAGKPVDNADVLWGSTGKAGWVDQGGALRALGLGVVSITASVHGQFVTRQIKVEAPPPAAEPTVRHVSSKTNKRSKRENKKASPKAGL